MNPLANLHLPQVPALQYVQVLQDFLPDFPANILPACGSGICARCRILYWRMGKRRFPSFHWGIGTWANVG
jgi:hypothetical protein